MTEIPDAELKPARRSFFDRFSVVWLVPLGALVISGAIAWQSYSNRGPLIEISFADAAGVHAGDTELRYRDVSVGVVEEVKFSEGLDSVIVAVRLDKELAPYVDEDSEFWVVRPQVTAQGVTGLSTVLSGVYIQGSWDSTPGNAASSFVGLASAPVARPDVPGVQVTLSSDTGDGLLQGTPVLFRGLQVGAVANVRLSPDAQSVLADAFIEAPYDQMISSATRFWNVSGFSFTLGPRGATLDVSSLAALVTGGVALENLVSGGDPVDSGTVFSLYTDRQEALTSIFDDSEAVERVNIGMIFSGNVSGLTAGSAVEFRGLRVGQVTNVTGIFDEEQFGDRRVRLLATVAVDPSRMIVLDGRSIGNTSAQETLAFLDELAQRGFRGRLARGSILSGGLKIVLEQDDRTEAGILNRAAEPFPVFPTAVSDVPDASDTVEGLIARVNDLPIESILTNVSELLANVNSVIASDAVQTAPREVAALIKDFREVIGSDAIQGIPNDVVAILDGVKGTVGDVRDVVGEFREAGAINALTEALAKSAPMMEAVDRLVAAAEPAVAELPALLERLGATAGDVARLAKNVADLPLGDIVASASETVNATRDLIASDEVQQVPRDAAAVLAEVRQTLQDMRDAQLVAELSGAVTSAGDAADQLALATQNLPELIDRISAVAATIEGLPLNSALGAAERTMLSASQIMEADSTRALPAELNAALAELRTIIADFREAGIVAQVNQTLAEANEAAIAVREATVGVPEVIAGIDQLTQTANRLPLEQLTTDVAALASATEELLRTQGMRDLPVALNGALSEVQLALAELRDGGLIAAANETLASARDAAAAIEQASATLPDLAARLDRLASQAERTLAGYDEGSELTREAQSTLREVQSAARAVSALARQIERNPNSLLMGR